MDSTDTRPAPCQHQLALWVFLACFMTYIITMPGYMWSTDGITRLRVAEQLAAGNGWHLEPGSIYEGWTVQGPDGKAYSFYGLGISLVYVPFVVAARTIADGGGLPEAAAIEFVASLVNPLLGALLCAMFFCCF
ncbi:MAG: hypothetical protein HC893_15875 [Chloroflexaceae bacterium]|nr:hypothetical protein [Chloroflexaceae bacterium]